MPKKNTQLMVAKSSNTSVPIANRQLVPASALSVSVSDQPTIRVIKQAQATKLSPTAPGILTYAIGVEDQGQALFIRILSNSSEGYFSQEWLTVENLQRCLETVNVNEVFPATIFKSAFVSRSQNNPGFLAAVLKAEGIIQKDADRIHGLTYDPAAWQAWQAQWRNTTAQVSNPEEDALLDQVMLTD